MHASEKALWHKNYFITLSVLVGQATAYLTFYVDLLSRPNKVGLKRPSVRPQKVSIKFGTRSMSDLRRYAV